MEEQVLVIQRQEVVSLSLKSIRQAITSWKVEFPWIKPVYGNGASGSSGTVEGILCSLCQCHQRKQRNGIGTWTEKPCTLLRKDTLLHPAATQEVSHAQGS